MEKKTSDEPFVNAPMSEMLTDEEIAEYYDEDSLPDNPDDNQCLVEYHQEYDDDLF